MGELGLAEVIAQIRRELADAVAAGEHADIQFPVGEVTVEFKVGVTRSGGGKGGLRVWVLELGAEAQYSKESLQTVTMILEAPVDPQGRPIKVSSSSSIKPG